MLATTGIFLSLGAFFLKHFIVDFPMQIPWMYRNKHIWGHPGGLAHAALHGITTALILYWLALCGAAGATVLAFPVIWFLAVLCGLIDFGIHYVTDYGKMNLNMRMNWKPDNSEWFWYSLGADQLIHNLTYLFLLTIWWF